MQAGALCLDYGNMCMCVGGWVSVCQVCMCVGSVCVLSVCEQEEVAAFFWYGPANEASVVDEKGVRRTTLWRLMRQWWDCNCQSVDWFQGPRTGGQVGKHLTSSDRGFKRLGGGAHQLYLQWPEWAG